MKRLMLLFCLLLWLPTLSQAAQEEWVYGVWELQHDPDDVKKDLLEFLPNGDVFNIWHDGTRITGFYVVTSYDVKAVFTIEGKDLLTTFHFNETRDELRIVTSDTGQETIYQKILSR